MDPPVITHSPTCLCSDCSWQPPSTHGCGAPVQGAQSHAEGNVLDDQFLHNNRTNFSLEYVIVCCVVSLFVGVSFAFFLSSLGSGSNEAVTYYYQDLNSVEMKIGASPIDPEVIKAIHHFQNYPFGRLPDQQDPDQVEAVKEIALAETASKTERSVKYYRDREVNDRLGWTFVFACAFFIMYYFDMFRAPRHRDW